VAFVITALESGVLRNPLLIAAGLAGLKSRP